MRTTLDLDPSVLDALRRRGKREHKSMGTVATELLARALANEAYQPAVPFRWSTADLGTPRVDLEDDEAVQAVLDGRG